MEISLGTTTSIATVAASTDTTIPNDNAGVVAKRIKLTATLACWVKLGTAATTAVAGSAGILVQPGDSVILKVGLNTHIAAIRNTADGTLSIAAVD